VLPTVHVLGADIRLFGVCVLLAVIACLVVVGAGAAERGGPDRWALEGVVVGTVGGLAGARLYYVLEHGEGGIGRGGLVWYGGVAGGTVAVLAYLALRKIPILLACDAAALALPVAQAIGRIGCQLAGDGDYGRPSGLPWAMGYPDGTEPTPPGVHVHPTPVYEALALSLVALLLWRHRDRLRGRLLPCYLVLVGTERFFVEFLRRNPSAVISLTTAQLVSAALVSAGAVWLLAAAQGRQTVAPSVA
jgi:phosphatidylglycerol:prolipoprotein diacylglycerol transferase